MKNQIVVSAIIILLTLSTHAASTDLGVIKGAEMETIPGKELTNLIKANASDKTYIVTGVVLLQAITYHCKWFYDPSKNALVVMQRIVTKGAGEDYVWRVWHDIKPEQFANKLPYGDDTIKTTPSPFRNAIKTLLLMYPDSPELTEWP